MKIINESSPSIKYNEVRYNDDESRVNLNLSSEVSESIPNDDSINWTVYSDYLDDSDSSNYRFDDNFVIYYDGKYTFKCRW